MKYIKVVWALVFGYILAVPTLWVAGFLLGIANFKNPIKTANYIVRTT
jgi:hypothetical protein